MTDNENVNITAKHLDTALAPFKLTSEELEVVLYESNNLYLQVGLRFMKSTPKEHKKRAETLIIATLTAALTTLKTLHELDPK